MAYLKKILLIIFLLLGSTTKEQGTGINLVQNPSFEEYDSCPVDWGELYKSKHWWGWSTDYYNSCSIYMSVPYNNAGFQYAHSGVAYAGFILYLNNHINVDSLRESIKSILIEPLEANKMYCTNFYISLAESSYQQSNNFHVQLDSIGMLFTQNQIQDTNLLICNNCAQVNKSISLLDTVNWLKISGNFIASGGEKYLAISNFQNVIHWTVGETGLTYVYIDDVSVCECSFKFSLGNDTTLCVGQSLTLNPNLPNAKYTWQDGSHDSTYKVTQTGTYWVRAYFADYNITTYDTINIAYINCDTIETIIPDIYIPNSFTPNGDGKNDVFKAVSLYEFSEFKLSVFNRWQGLLFESNDINIGWDGTYKGKPVLLGVYVYQLTATIKDTGEQRKITGRVTVVR